MPPRWRFEVDLTEPVPQPLLPYENYLDSVWLELQVIHTAFRGVDQAEYWTLIQKLHDIELIFLDRPELDEYYTECYMNERAVHDHFHKDEFGLPHPTRETEKVAALQAQFMEDVFYVLRLDRYGNARDNRGWMNLLRRWGRSPTFNKRFDELRSTFSEEFVTFYNLYLRDRFGTIDQSPIPHPWDRPRHNVGPGIFLDAGIREVSGAHHDERTGERPVPQPGTGAHGIQDEKGGEPLYESPKPPSEPEGGGGPSGGLPNA
jgi:hypothetical protein